MVTGRGHSQLHFRGVWISEAFNGKLKIVLNFQTAFNFSQLFLNPGSWDLACSASDSGEGMNEGLGRVPEELPGEGSARTVP